jgi:hypothetical protein
MYVINNGLHHFEVLNCIKLNRILWKKVGSRNNMQIRPDPDPQNCELNNFISPIETSERWV